MRQKINMQNPNSNRLSVLQSKPNLFGKCVVDEKPLFTAALSGASISSQTSWV